MHKIKYLQFGGTNSVADSFIGSVTNSFGKNISYNPQTTDYGKLFGLTQSKLFTQPQTMNTFGLPGNTPFQNQLALNEFDGKVNIWKKNTFGPNDNSGFGGVKAKKPLISKEQGKEIGNDLLSVAPQAGEAILQTAGKEADNISAGEQVFSKATDVAWNVALKSGNPYAMAAAGVAKGLDWVNRFAGSTAKRQDTADMNIVGYGTQINTMAGKKNTVIGGLSRKTAKANRLTDKYETRNLLAGNASQTALKNVQSGLISSQDVATKSSQELGGSNLYQNKLLTAKKGTKINPAKLRNISNKVKKKDKVDKFENGGKINVIPEGALHKNLNHYEGELGDSVTSKGIPVITKSGGGNIEQHAEIERNEVILHKEATDKIEALFKDYAKAESQKEKDKIATEAGKYLTYELLENTQDNTGLIATV